MEAVAAGSNEGKRELDIMSGIDVTGMSTEDIEELIEVRTRYAEQTKQQQQQQEQETLAHVPVEKSVELNEDIYGKNSIKAVGFANSMCKDEVKLSSGTSRLDLELQIIELLKEKAQLQQLIQVLESNNQILVDSLLEMSNTNQLLIFQLTGEQDPKLENSEVGR